MGPRAMALGLLCLLLFAAPAVAEGVKAITEGPLWPECHDRAFREALAAWRKDAKQHGISKKRLKAYDEVVAPFDEALSKDGWKAFCKRNAKSGRL